MKPKFLWKFRLAAMHTAALAALMAPNSGIAQVYLHSDQEEQLANDFAANLEKARTAQIAALDAHREYVANTLTREQQLIVKREIAIRDFTIVQILAAESASGSDNGKLENQFSKLQEAVEADWTLLTGVAKMPPGLALKLRNGAFSVASSEIVLNRARSSLNLAISQLETENGVKGDYCNSEGEGTPHAVKDGVEINTIAVAVACQAVRDNYDPIKRSYRDIDSDKSININGLSVLLGNTDPPPQRAGAPQIGGEMGQALSTLARLEGLRKAQLAVAKAVTAQDKALEGYYKCQVALSDRGNAVPGEIENLAKRIQAALLQLSNGKKKDENGKDVDIDPLDTAAFTSIYDALQTKLPDACAKGEPADKGEGPAESPSGLSAQQILALLRAGDGIATHGTVLAAIQKEALAAQVGTFSNILTGLATSNAKDQATPEGKIAAATLRIIGNVETIGEAKSGRLPDLSGVLVALADVRMRQEISKIESDRLDDLINFANRQINALRDQAIYLAEARNAMEQQSATSFSSALLFYLSSWNKGHIPQSVIADAMVTSRYLPWLARERAVVSAGYAMLAPAASELNAYVKGGLTPATFAQYLQVLGLGAIAVKK